MMETSGRRETGIEVIGAVPWGTHFCQFYKTKQDLIDILVPYFREGLEHNEYCMWVTSLPLAADEARAAIRCAMPDFDRYLAKGQIEIIPYTDWYLKGGVFDQKRVLDGWVERLQRALRDGYAGLRLSGNTFWLEKPDWHYFTDYEEAVNGVIGKFRMMALCTYSMDRCGADEVIDVVRNHQFALIKREGDWVLIESSERKRAEEAIMRLNWELTEAVEALRAKSVELESANVKLKELDRLKSMFISSMSHELRTPLNTIIGFSGILLQGIVGELTEEQRKQLTMVKESADHLLALINDIIDISKIEAGRAEVAVGDFDLVELVRDAVDSVAVAAREKGLTLSVSAPDALVIAGDRRRTKQILVNLLGNAVKFTDSGGIDVDVVRRGRGVEIAVRDTGIGIRKDDLGKLFAAFSQILTEGRVREGSGLGLYLSQKIAKVIGGNISVQSEPGKGSVFTLSLPSNALREVA